MKKLFSFILGALFAISLFSVSFGDSVLDYLDDLGGTVLFGYSSTEQISVDSIDSSSITIESPVLEDEFEDIISDYTLMYEEYPLIDVLDDPSLLDYSREKNFSNLDLVGENNFTMELDTGDDIDDETIYYVVAVPKDDAGSLGEISNEICFRLYDSLYGEGDECEDAGEVGHAAGADMNLANVSHTINGDSVTLRWIAVNGSDEIDIFLRNEDQGTFSKLATVDMDDESYSFTISENGEHIVKFIPNNGGVEKNYTFNAMGIGDGEPEPTPTTVTPVVVGPKENIILIVIGTILVYLLYRLSRRKS
ncbi:MAG TPA: hypothetical protein P5060_01015 [Candidatus Absconditabacterales bacterium]|nr:hypothetical protein [Candidatus Absconditabacterales bacterium]